jgi:hypothetical protein
MTRVEMISSLTDAAAARLTDPATMADLADRVTSVPVPDTAGDRTRVRHLKPSGRPGRGRLATWFPVAAGLALAGVLAGWLAWPGQHVGPSAGRGKAQLAVMSFTQHDGYIDVIVRNPVADPKRYRIEFEKHHLNISLRLVPASPSLVGTLVFESLTSGARLRPITAIGKCFSSGGGNQCPVGVRVPLNFHGAAILEFGRAAKPGEPYQTAAPANAPGEVMHGLHYQGKTVAAVLAMLAGRHVKVNHYIVQQTRCKATTSRSVLASWRVYDADPWSSGQVVLWVAKTRSIGACRPVPVTPAPSPRSTTTGR